VFRLSRVKRMPSVRKAISEKNFHHLPCVLPLRTLAVETSASGAFGNMCELSLYREHSVVYRQSAGNESGLLQVGLEAPIELVQPILNPIFWARLAQRGILEYTISATVNPSQRSEAFN
jgi:hypothetical protein